ncbi:hypothetical protein B6U82_00545 [Candidatus Pacearchaeota archaeon ex4484_31]|nr:MAG: hypothetical protein B6U82_00545 [Candidatus Pacearchaeota archaeon ex4484_31]
MKELKKEVEKASNELKKIFKEKGFIKIFTHFDADGISSAAIITKLLKENDQLFHLTALKNLTDVILEEIKKEIKEKKYKAVFFLDLGASKLKKIFELKEYGKIFVLDHHQINESLNLYKSDDFFFIYSSELSSSVLCYLFAKQFNISTAKIAMVGLVGDNLNKELSRYNSLVVEEAIKEGVQKKRTVSFFPATEPLPNVLRKNLSENENDILKKASIKVRSEKGLKSIVDLNGEELSRLITTLLLNKADEENLIEDIYIVSFCNKLFDIREVVAMINACGKLNALGLGVAFLLESPVLDEVENIYIEYKRKLLEALKAIEKVEKRKGNSYLIINAKSKISDVLISNVISIVMNSFSDPNVFLFCGLAYENDRQIKISARIKGNKNINLASFLNSIVKNVGGESGGHEKAAGALIPIEKEKEFLSLLEEKLKEVE